MEACPSSWFQKYWVLLVGTVSDSNIVQQQCSVNLVVSDICVRLPEPGKRLVSAAGLLIYCQAIRKPLHNHSRGSWSKHRIYSHGRSLLYVRIRNGFVTEWSPLAMVVATCHDNLSPCGIPHLISAADICSLNHNHLSCKSPATVTASAAPGADWQNELFVVRPPYDGSFVQKLFSARAEFSARALKPNSINWW